MNRYTEIRHWGHRGFASAMFSLIALFLYANATVIELKKAD